MRCSRSASVSGSNAARAPTGGSPTTTAVPPIASIATACSAVSTLPIASNAKSTPPVRFLHVLDHAAVRGGQIASVAPSVCASAPGPGRDRSRSRVAPGPGVRPGRRRGRRHRSRSRPRSPPRHLRRPPHGADAGGHAAADQRHHVERRIGVNRNRPRLGDHRLLGKRRDGQVVVGCAPPPRCSLVVPSYSTPCGASTSAHSSQRAGCPPRQFAQRPHAGTHERITRSPSCTEVTPHPVASTVPLPSCPITSGAATCQSPRRTWRSLWHTPAAAMRNAHLARLRCVQFDVGDLDRQGWVTKDDCAHHPPRYQGRMRLDSRAPVTDHPRTSSPVDQPSQPPRRSAVTGRTAAAAAIARLGAIWSRRTSRYVYAIILRGYRALRERRRGCVPGCVRAGVRAARDAAGRRRTAGLDRAGDPQPVYGPPAPAPTPRGALRRTVTDLDERLTDLDQALAVRQAMTGCRPAAPISSTASSARTSPTGPSPPRSGSRREPSRAGSAAA